MLWWAISPGLMMHLYCCLGWCKRCIWTTAGNSFILLSSSRKYWWVLMMGNLWNPTCSISKMTCYYKSRPSYKCTDIQYTCLYAYTSMCFCGDMYHNMTVLNTLFKHLNETLQLVDLVPHLLMFALLIVLYRMVNWFFQWHFNVRCVI